jgi:hypothetical protein
MPPPPSHPDLSTIQRWFQSVISHPQGISTAIDTEEAQKLIAMKRSELEQVIKRSKNLSAEERLGIYANAYYARLLECLRESFPVLAKTLGHDVFDEFAFDYLQQYPSKSYTLNRLGDQFAKFLDDTRPDRTDATPSPQADWPDFLIDLARLEWNIEKVFDGPGNEGKAIVLAGDLQKLTAEEFGQSKLIPVVSLRLLEFKFPINDYYTAARKAKETSDCPPPPEPRRQFLALARRDFVVRRTELSQAQHALLAALRESQPVAQAIAAAADCADSTSEQFASEIGQWFQAWTAAGFFERIER